VHCKAFPLLFVFLLELIYFEDQKSFFSFTLLQINQVSHLFGKHILNHFGPHFAFRHLFWSIHSEQMMLTFDP